MMRGRRQRRRVRLGVPAEAANARHVVTAPGTAGLGVGHAALAIGHARVGAGRVAGARRAQGTGIGWAARRAARGAELIDGEARGSRAASPLARLAGGAGVAADAAMIGVGLGVDAIEVAQGQAGGTAVRDAGADALPAGRASAALAIGAARLPVGPAASHPAPTNALAKTIRATSLVEIDVGAPCPPLVRPAAEGGFLLRLAGGAHLAADATTVGATVAIPRDVTSALAAESVLRTLRGAIAAVKGVLREIDAGAVAAGEVAAAVAIAGAGVAALAQAAAIGRIARERDEAAAPRAFRVRD